LIAESGGRGDLGQGPTGRRQWPASVLNAQLANMLADGTAKVTTECSGQMNRMDTDFIRNGIKRSCSVYRLREMSAARAGQGG
jgi:hypothetical protein